MSTRRNTLKGGLWLASSQAVSQASNFLRNVILARFLSPADFGVAAVFAMTLNLLDLLDMSYDKLLIQARDGNEERFQSTIQWMLLIRGVFTAALIVGAAPFVSKLFGVPRVQWAFYFLAAVPLFRGLTHLDRLRLQREMKFGVPAVIGMSTSILILLLAWPLAYWTRDYRAMLWLLIARVGVNVIASHCVAVRPYSCVCHREYVRRAFVFGWPLLLNGFLIFGIFQGDQFIIGSANRIFHHSFYTLADLGRYALAFSLTMAPTIVVANITSTLFLPLLARIDGGAKQFERRYSICTQGLALISGGIALPFILCGGQIVSKLYGSPYSSAAGLVGWLAAMQAVRVLRVGPNQAAMAKGDTKNTMLANIVRSVALVGSLLVAWWGGPLTYIAIAGLGGEILALIASAAILSKAHGVPALLCLKPAGMAAAILAIALGLAARFTPPNPFMQIALTLGLELVMFGYMFALLPPLRRAALSSLHDLLLWEGNLKANGLSLPRTGTLGEGRTYAPVDD